MDKPSRFASVGVRGRLLLAFLAICMFSLVAAASGFYSLSQVGGALKRITEQRVPDALSGLELSRRVERVVRAAPALLVVNSESARVEVSNEITSQAEQLNPLLQRSRNYKTDEEEAAAVQAATLVADLNENLVSLDELVKQRLSIVDHRDKLVRQLGKANKVVQRTLSPGARIMGAQIADWNRSGKEANSSQPSTELLELSKSIIGLIPQQKASVLADAIQNDLLNIIAADTAESIDVLIFPLKRSLEELSVSRTRFPWTQNWLNRSVQGGPEHDRQF